MRAFLAITAGLVFTVVVSTLFDLVMHSTGVFPAEVPGMTTSDWLVATSYRLFAAIGGGWITAQLAPGRPMCFSRWRPALLVVTALPCTRLGGMLNPKSKPLAAA